MRSPRPEPTEIVVTVIRVTILFSRLTRESVSQNERLKSRERVWKKTDRERIAGNIKIRTRKRFVAYSWHKINGEHLSALGSHQRGH